jgi:hypothetical protein
MPRRKKAKQPTTASAIQGPLGVARALEGVDLDKLIGRNELLRGIADFRSQVSPFTGMLDQQPKLRELFSAMSAIDSLRRDVLGTAFVASKIAANRGLDRRQFLDRSTASISAIAAAQLSVGAKQAMLGRALELPSIRGIAEPREFTALSRLSEDFHKALLVRRPRALGASLFADSLRRLTLPFASGAWSFLNELQSIDEDALLFVERHGWPLPLALPVTVVHRVARLARSGKRKVNQLMVATFQPRTKAFRTSRDRLLDSAHFTSRRQPIKQGLQALSRGHYYASICTMLPLVEGVLVDVALAENPPATGAPKQAIAHLRQAGDEPDAVMVGSIETLLISATSGAALFGNFDRRDYGGAGESRRLNRHAILHGSARRYGTHANALKLFLLLVALAETLAFYENEKARLDAT